MKKVLIVSLAAVLMACNKDTGNSATSTSSGTTTSGGSSSGCGTHNGKALHRGSDGGCYYINSNGNKTYVARSECTCP